MFKKRLGITLIIEWVSLLSMQFEIPTQSQEKNYSLLMLSFAKGIQWPKQVESSSFVIGVFEYPPLASELSSTSANVKIGNKKIEVKEFDYPDEIRGCHILFIPAYKAKQLTNVLAKLGTYPTLVITNKTDLAKKGSDVNFVLVDGKLKYEINCKSIEKRGMKISSSIKGLGIVVG